MSLSESTTGKSPDAFRTISEVADELDLPQHVLRFWETRFAQVKPMKRGGGRRLYRPDHIALLRGIKALLYDDGLTIKGVQKMLREKGSKTVVARGLANAELSLEPTEVMAGSMLPLDLPEDAAERLSALKTKVKGQAAPQAKPVDAATVRATISRLEALLVKLESEQG